MSNTKKSLITSAISLAVSAVLLISTTFAWFTDSVINQGNKIQSGNLNVELWQKTNTLSQDQIDEGLPSDAEYTNISDSVNPVFNSGLWEPGYSNGATLQVRNNGTLALKYELAIRGIVTATGAQNGGSASATGNIADVLDVYFLDSYRAPTSADTPIGTLAYLMTNPVIDSAMLASGNCSNDINIVLKMKDNAGNEYQGASATFDVELRAIQATSEADGFGNINYDANADGNPDNPSWDAINTGKVVVPVAPSGDTTITSVDGAATFTVPSSAVEDGVDQLTLNIVETSKPSEVPVDPGQDSVTYDITIDGIKENLTGDDRVTVTFFIGKDLVNVKMYHYDRELTAQDDDFAYDPVTGYVSFKASEFSPYTITFTRSTNTSTADDFVNALQKGGLVTLENDITLSSVAVVPEGVTVTINLGGHTISGRGIRNLGTIVSLTNGSIIADSGYGLDNRANIGTLNCNITSKTSDAISNGTGTWQGDEYISTAGVINEIAGGNYFGRPETYGSSSVGSCGLYNDTYAVVKLISGGRFQGSSVAFRDYNKDGGIKSVTGGFFDCPYMDANGKTFCDNTTIDEVFYNTAPVSVTGGTWYNVGTKINNSLADGYTVNQGDVCAMTSHKRYDSTRHWVDDESGTVYYYYTVGTAK